MLTRFVVGSIFGAGLVVFTACSSSDSAPAAGADAGATSSSGDSGHGGGTVPTGGACDGTQAGANTCAGGICLGLNANEQNKQGICTAQCSSSLPCAVGSSCADFGGQLGTICLRDCTTDAQCSDGFICLDGGSGDGSKFCFVNGEDEPDAGGTPDAGGDAGGDYCKAQDCDILTDTKGYCDNNTAAKRVCDCPSGKTPNAACTAAMTGANLWCCPAAP